MGGVTRVGMELAWAANHREIAEVRTDFHHAIPDICNSYTTESLDMEILHQKGQKLTTTKN